MSVDAYGEHYRGEHLKAALEENKALRQELQTAKEIVSSLLEAMEDDGDGEVAWTLKTQYDMQLARDLLQK